MDGMMMSGLMPMLQSLITPEMLDSVAAQIGERIHSTGVIRIDAVVGIENDYVTATTYSPEAFTRMILDMMLEEMTGTTTETDQ